ncbi:hypothetical protein [Spirillospora sp. CA-294931]|uniref:hypothetical protein n=1 Tax=Spirillospora sp. CA-294931 TaxID=3240042 RepID=UPI003D8A2433
MARSPKPKELRVGPVTYFRSTGHQCGVDGSCREIVSVRHADASGPGLRVTFAASPGHLVGDHLLHRGGVVRARDDVYLNLHRPAVVRALLDEAIAQGWDTRSPLDLDGWSLMDAVLTRLNHPQ